MNGHYEYSRINVFVVTSNHQFSNTNTAPIVPSLSPRPSSPTQSIHSNRFRISPQRRLQYSRPLVPEKWMAKLRDAFAVGPAFLAMQWLLHSRFVPVPVAPPDPGRHIREN